MQNKRYTTVGGAVSIPHFRPFGRAFLPWAAAAALFFVGDLAAQAQSFKPGPLRCNVSGTTVTCTGDLSGGVAVEGGIGATAGTYTKLIVRDLIKNIVRAVASGQAAEIYFDGDGDINIEVDTGDFRIITLDSCVDCPGIAAYSNESGAVTVSVKGNIATSGQSSEGIDAFSTGDTGGPVVVKMEGNIVTTGDSRSHGIAAGSETDDVTIEMDGNITVSGERSKGIDAGSNGGNIGITLLGGTITSNQSEGIEFNDGADNTLTINNAVKISGGANDVGGGDGNETIDNYGTLTTPGSIDLGGGMNTFNNRAGATFNSGTSVNLGSGNKLANAGDLSPGGANVVLTTGLTGNFENFMTDEQNIEEEGTFIVSINNTGSDQLTVTGTAVLRGTVRVRGAYSESGRNVDRRYTILNAATGFSGTFEDVMDTLFIDYGLFHDPSNIYVDLTSERKAGVTFGEFAATANQRAVADALDSLPADNPIVLDVMAATELKEARAAYDTLTGEVRASLNGALMGAGQRQAAAVNRRMNARGGTPTAPAAMATSGNPASPAGGDSGFWIASYGGWSETAATAGTARLETDRRGVVFGIDGELGGGWDLGVLGGFSRTEVRQGARLSSGSVDTWSVGLYGDVGSGASRFGFGAVYNGHAIDTRRSVPPTGALTGTQRLSASYDARNWQLFAEAGHRMQAGDLTLEPFAGVSHTSLDTEGFTETGGNAALTASAETDSKTFATLGVRGAMQVDDTIHLRGMAGWRHAFGDAAPSSTHRIADSDPFTVTGAPIARDSLEIELGIEADLSDTAVLGAAYKGRYGGAAVHGFNAGVKVKF